LEKGWQAGEDRRGLQDDGDRPWRPHPRRDLRLLDLADDGLHGLLNLLHGAALAGPAKVRDPVEDVLAVPRQVVRERHQLVSEGPADSAQNGEREEDGHEDRGHAPQPSAL
jgi:hypothetical protein